jgi:hypothetical protein
MGQAAVVASFGRGVSVNVCLVVLGLGYGGLLMALVAGAWAYGRPWAWPRWTTWGVMLAAAVFAVVWWWIDQAVEGRELLSFGGSHGLTVGDLVAVPALLAGALLLVAASSRRPSS